MNQVYRIESLEEPREETLSGFLMSDFFRKSVSDKPQCHHRHVPFSVESLLTKETEKILNACHFIRRTSESSFFFDWDVQDALLLITMRKKGYVKRREGENECQAESLIKES